MREVTLEEMAENIDNQSFGDDRLGVMFYSKLVEDTARTRKEGRKCFREREYVKIIVPGDRHNSVDRPVQRTGILPTDDVLRFPKQYERFKQGRKQELHEGVPLTLWPQMPAALAEELKFVNIFTIEQLASLDDNYVARIPKGHEWKQKAQAFLGALKDQEQVSKLQAELQARDNKIEALEVALKDQAAKIETLLKKQK